MVRTLLKKSWSDLTKRKARTSFTILTIALAVASFGMFGAPALLDDAILGQIEESQTHHVEISVDDVNFSQTQMADLQALPNVEVVDGHAFYATRMWVDSDGNPLLSGSDGRRAEVILVSVDDFADQSVNVVSLDEGSFPGYMELIGDSANRRQNTFSGGVGADVRIIDHTEAELIIPIVGEGSNLVYSFFPMDGSIVLYGTTETIHQIGNKTGYDFLDFRLLRNDAASVDTTVEAVRTYLTSSHNETVAFMGLPEIIEPGTYPGQEDFSNIIGMFSVVSALALFAALFLLLNSMNTMVSEQTAQIGAMKAIGGRYHHIAAGFLFTALLMGLIGTLIGLPLGSLAGFLLARTFGTSFFGISPSLSLNWTIFLVSAVVGLVGAMVASIPALWKAIRLSTREALESKGISSDYGMGLIDRTLMKFSWLPRSFKLGLRSISRRKGRSIAIILVVALATGNLMGIMAFGTTLSTQLGEEYDNLNFDIWVDYLGGPLEFNETVAGDLQAEYPEFDLVEPLIFTPVEFAGKQAPGVGLRANTTTYIPHFDEGRWFTAAEESSYSRVAVFGSVIAKQNDVSVGDFVEVVIATGPVTVEVVGLDTNQMNNGGMIFFPLESFQDMLQRPEFVTTVWIQTVSTDNGVIDTTATAFEDDLVDQGYSLQITLKHVIEEQNQAMNGMIILMSMVLGFLIIGISMVGLVNNITMNVIERTKEIGILRTIGAKSGDIWRIFGFEGLVLSTLGWAFGILVGFGVLFFLMKTLEWFFGVEGTMIFPWYYPIWVLVGTWVITLLVMIPPLYRAGALKPGAALRYE